MDEEDAYWAKQQDEYRQVCDGWGDEHEWGGAAVWEIEDDEQDWLLDYGYHSKIPLDVHINSDDATSYNTITRDDPLDHKHRAV